MRKILLLLLAITLLSACQTVDQAPKVSYTGEFDFLPKLPNMELVELIDQEVGNEYRSATYIVKSADIETVMQEYQNLLHEDRWTVTNDNKPTSLEAINGDHLVNIFAYQKDTDVQLGIVAK